MNTTERIVESYFRLCRGCFTQPDVKVIRGNNRQIDLLAYHIPSDKSYHVEVSVTHCKQWCPTPAKLRDNFEKKFFGAPPKKVGANTDYARGKTYETNIIKTYMALGIKPEKIIRTWVCWTVSDDDNLESELADYCSERNINRESLEIISFRDVILPELMEKVSTSNYEDDSLRTLSLLRQYEKQQA